jgi:hypothetical protein
MGCGLFGVFHTQHTRTILAGQNRVNLTIKRGNKMYRWIMSGLSFLLMMQPVQAMQFWPEDKVTQGLLISANVLMAVDWTQTRYIADNPQEYAETGPAAESIGAHPTTGAVNQHFIESLIVMNGLGYVMPESLTTFGITWSPKKMLYLGYSVYEGYYVQQNYEIGIRGQF